MPSTTTYELGDVVRVPFPFTDQTAVKKRPAVVISSPAYHRERRDLILMAVTSQVRPSRAGSEVAVTRWKEAGRLKPSVIKPVIATVDGGHLLSKQGRHGRGSRDDQMAEG